MANMGGKCKREGNGSQSPKSDQHSEFRVGEKNFAPVRRRRVSVRHAMVRHRAHQTLELFVLHAEAMSLVESQPQQGSPRHPGAIRQRAVIQRSESLRGVPAQFLGAIHREAGGFRDIPDHSSVL